MNALPVRAVQYRRVLAPPFLSSLSLPYSHRLPADRLLADDVPFHRHFFQSSLVKNPLGFCAHASDVMNITGRAQPFLNSDFQCF